MGEYKAVGSSRAGVRVRSAGGKDGRHQDGAWTNIGQSGPLGLVFGYGRLRTKMAAIKMACG